MKSALYSLLFIGVIFFAGSAHAQDDFPPAIPPYPPVDVPVDAGEIIDDVGEPRSPRAPRTPAPYGYGGGLQFPPVEPPDGERFKETFGTLVDKFQTFVSRFFR